MELTMGVWPQSTSKAKPSTLSTPRNLKKPDVQPTLKKVPLSFGRRIKQSQVRTFHAFSMYFPAHNIRRNGLPLQRHFPKAFYISKSSTARATFTTS